MSAVANAPSNTDAKPTDVERYPEMWEDRWVTGSTFWDKGSSHEFLVEFLGSKESDEAGIPREGRAFVPGCGQGYDLELFARRGLDTTGLDVAKTGVIAANKWLSTQPKHKGTAVAVEGDFFTYKTEPFDLIYDYTFLCALPPTLRPNWGARMTELAKKSPSTRLITLMYPLEGNPLPFGPPFSLSEGVYDEILKDWEIVWSKEIPQTQRRKEAPPGGEKLAVWKLK